MHAKIATAVLLAALASLHAVAHAADTPAQVVKDTVITGKIKAAQAKDPLVRAMKIDVETDNSGKVVLSGNAKSQAEVDRAMQIAKSVEGVSSVQNSMQVAGTSAQTAGNSSDGASPSQRTADTMRAPKADRN